MFVEILKASKNIIKLFLLFIFKLKFCFCNLELSNFNFKLNPLCLRFLVFIFDFEFSTLASSFLEFYIKIDTTYYMRLIKQYNFFGCQHPKIFIYMSISCNVNILLNHKYWILANLE